MQFHVIFQIYLKSFKDILIYREDFFIYFEFPSCVAYFLKVSFCVYPVRGLLDQKSFANRFIKSCLREQKCDIFSNLSLQKLSKKHTFFCCLSIQEKCGNSRLVQRKYILNYLLKHLYSRIPEMLVRILTSTFL